MDLSNAVINIYNQTKFIALLSLLQWFWHTRYSGLYRILQKIENISTTFYHNEMSNPGYICMLNRFNVGVPLLPCFEVRRLSYLFVLCVSQVYTNKINHLFNTGSEQKRLGVTKWNSQGNLPLPFERCYINVFVRSFGSGGAWNWYLCYCRPRSQPLNPCDISCMREFNQMV